MKKFHYGKYADIVKRSIVIPKEILDTLGIHPGSLVEVRLANKHIEIIPLPESPIVALRGTLRTRKSLPNQLIHEHRQEVRYDGKRSKVSS